MSKKTIRWYKPQGGIYGDKDNHRDRAASGTAGSAGILTDQEQKKERVRTLRGTGGAGGLRRNSFSIGGLG